jgi:sulfite oxidase
MHDQNRRRFLSSAAAACGGGLGWTSLSAMFRSGRMLASVLPAVPVYGSAGPEGAADPEKPELFFHPGAPRNAEPPLPLLVESWRTPVSRFFVRSHGLNPKIDLAAYRVTIEGLVDRPGQFTLQELLSRGTTASCTATLTCAGNRRSEFSRIKPVSGVQWKEGAIGNAVWSGVRLSDVLRAAGIRESARHVWFDGLDEVKDGARTFPFGGSVPLSKVFRETTSKAVPLLATQMNGQPLTMDHGMPLRAVIPGYIGARSVKWLGKITVSDRPSPNHFVEDVYKILESDTPTQRDEAAPIYRFPVNSVICSSVPVSVTPELFRVTGFALPDGGTDTEITTVEVSADNGGTWHQAQLGSEHQEFCWRFWTVDLRIPGASTLIVRATDSGGHFQPEKLVWNPKGYLNNSWHKVTWPAD